MTPLEMSKVAARLEEVIKLLPVDNPETNSVRMILETAIDLLRAKAAARARELMGSL